MKDTSITLVEELVEETRGLLTRGKELLVQVAYNLKTLKDSEEWQKYGHETFPKFCQEELELSQSACSKYLSVAGYFAEKYQPEEIGPTDIEKLYLAAKLPGTPEENLSRAKTWSREDFKSENAETLGEHTPTWVTYCDDCKVRQDRHP